jgi:hypothetical protein
VDIILTIKIASKNPNK